MIAWVSHHLPLADGTLVGGAEMSDNILLKDAPVDIKVIHSSNYKEALDYDNVVITGTDLLDPWAMTLLAKKKPAILLHHKQTPSHNRKLLLDSARVLICRTPKHLEIETSWTNPKRSTWVLSPLNPDEFKAKEKKPFALWAARMHQQKGPVEARAWADSQGIPLVMMHNKPRAEVLEAMSIAQHFVFLPNDFDAEPRALIEAVLSGCQIHTNDLAGLTSVPDWDNPSALSQLVRNAKGKFWDTILE